jgi:hypothetical protein
MMPSTVEKAMTMVRFMICSIFFPIRMIESLADQGGASVPRLLGRRRR